MLEAVWSTNALFCVIKALSLVMVLLDIFQPKCMELSTLREPNGNTSMFLGYVDLIKWPLQVVTAQLFCGYSAVTPLHGSSCWGNCSVPSWLFHYMVAPIGVTAENLQSYYTAFSTCSSHSVAILVRPM